MGSCPHTRASVTGQLSGRRCGLLDDTHQNLVLCAFFSFSDEINHKTIKPQKTKNKKMHGCEDSGSNHIHMLAAVTTRP